MVRLVEKLQPQWLIGENVRGFVNEPLGLQRSLSDLESIGYQAIPFIIPACAVDAPHRRDRVWIVAAKDVADASSLRLQGGEKPGSDQKQWPKSADKQFERSRWSDKPRRKGEAGWLPEPDVGRVAHGVPRRVDRLKALGNAVVPQVVTQIGKAILSGSF